jgi:hypothetical protein
MSNVSGGSDIQVEDVRCELRERGSFPWKKKSSRRKE